MEILVTISHLLVLKVLQEEGEEVQIEQVRREGIKTGEKGREEKEAKGGERRKKTMGKIHLQLRKKC